MEQTKEYVSIQNFAKGGAADAFNKCMEEVLTDIARDDKDETAQRSFNLKFTIEQKDDFFASTVSATTKLPGMNAKGATLFNDGSGHLYQSLTTQPELDLENVTPIDQNKEKEAEGT